MKRDVFFKKRNDFNYFVKVQRMNERLVSVGRNEKQKKNIFFQIKSREIGEWFSFCSSNLEMGL